MGAQEARQDIENGKRRRLRVVLAGLCREGVDAARSEEVHGRFGGGARTPVGGSPVALISSAVFCFGALIICVT